jgi:cytidylate kinase
MIIAIDGFSSAGKGTLAKNLANYFNLPYLNTGAVYRAVGLKALNKNVDFSDKDKLVEVAKTITAEDTEAEELHNERVGEVASKVAVIPEVRKVLLDFQRKFAYNKTGAILDGRDIGTVICPDADYKFFITASAEERAKRRFKESREKGIDCSLEEVLEKLKNRDARDSSRSSAPLVKADDAIEIDTTNMTIDEVFEFAISKISE